MTAFFPPIQTVRRAHIDRIATAPPRAKPARNFPRIPEDGRIEALGFAILVSATAATLFLSAVALLGFAAR